MGDVKMRRENIRYEARGKSFEIECPSGFSGIEAIVCWCDAGGSWHREAFESFLDARGPHPRGGTVAPRLSNNHPRGRSLPVPCRGRGPESKQQKRAARCGKRGRLQT